MGGYEPDENGNRPPPDPFLGQDVEWRFDWAGFTAGAAQNRFRAPPLRIDLHCVPYWAIVIPLTMLSAWLLLSKPRQAKTTPVPLS